MSETKCVKCGGVMPKRRKWYCSDACRWNDRHMEHPSKRNAQHFYQYGGTYMPRGQGKRSGGMVRGGMGFGGSMPHFSLAPLTKEGLDSYYARCSYMLRLGDGELVSKEQAYSLITEARAFLNKNVKP